MTCCNKDTCTLMYCTICDQCLPRHCTCGSNFNQVGRESRPCECPISSSALRCALCFGCAAKHCRCDLYRGKSRHSINNDRSDESSSPDLFSHLPAMDDMYQHKVRTESKKRVPAGQNTGKRKRRDASRDPMKPLGGVAMNTHANVLIDLAIENRDALETLERALPCEDLVDYIISVASIKCASVPELIGAFEHSSSAVLGIIVEEYLAQIVSEKRRRGHDDDHHEASGSRPAAGEIKSAWKDVLRGMKLPESEEEIEAALDMFQDLFGSVYGETSSPGVSQAWIKEQLFVMSENLRNHKAETTLDDQATSNGEHPHLEEAAAEENQFGQPSYQIKIPHTNKIVRDLATQREALDLEAFINRREKDDE